MSFHEYLQKEIAYIEWYSRFRKIPIEQACNMWVEQGLAELFARKYRSKLITKQPQQIAK